MHISSDRIGTDYNRETRLTVTDPFVALGGLGWKKIMFGFRKKIPPHALLGVLLSLIGLALSLAATFRAFGMEKLLAQGLGMIAALSIGVGLLLLVWKRGDERVTWEWEMELLRHALGGIHAPLLCRRHLTTRAQGRLLGCANAKRVQGSLDWMEKTLGAAEAEMRMERDSGLRELLEHQAVVANLHNTIGAAKIGFMSELDEIVAKGDSSPALIINVKGIQQNVRNVERLVKELGVEPLEGLCKRLTDTLKATGRNWSQLTGIEQGEIRGMVQSARMAVQSLRSYVEASKQLAERYQAEMSRRWQEDHEELRRDGSCSPEDKRPVPAAA